MGKRMGDSNMVAVAARLPQPFARVVSEMATLRNVSQSDIVREAVAGWVFNEIRAGRLVLTSQGKVLLDSELLRAKAQPQPVKRLEMVAEA
jgi:hypothetical protein